MAGGLRALGLEHVITLLCGVLSAVLGLVHARWVGLRRNLDPRRDRTLLHAFPGSASPTGMLSSPIASGSTTGPKKTPKKREKEKKKRQLLMAAYALASPSTRPAPCSTW